MSKEYRIRSPKQWDQEGIEELTRLSSFRDYDPVYKIYNFGTLEGEGNYPEIGVWIEGDSLGLSVYDVNGEAWRELTQFVRSHRDKHPETQIETWDEGYEASEDFEEDYP